MHTLTFAELNAEVNQLAHLLLQLGVKRDDKVVFAGKNSVGVVRMMHASRKIGATAVPLNYRLSTQEAAYVVHHCDAGLVYSDVEFRGLFEEIRSDIPQVDNVVIFDGQPGPDMLDGDALLAAASDAEPEPVETDEPAATMIYTSGTTGKPKGAFRRGMGNPEQVGAMVAHIGYRPEDIYLTTGPLYHSGPGGFMTLSHSLGNTVVLQRRFDAEIGCASWRLIASHRRSPRPRPFVWCATCRRK